MELFITALQHPRPDETVALHLYALFSIFFLNYLLNLRRQATEVQCEVAVISDAELMITRSRQDKYRLIIASRNRCTILAQDCKRHLVPVAHEA